MKKIKFSPVLPVYTGFSASTVSTLSTAPAVFSAFPIFFAAISLFALSSCSNTATVKVDFSDLSSAEIVVKQQNINRYDIVDTVKTDDSGKMSVRIPIEKNNPDFIYLYYNDKKLASLLLERGDKVLVQADTLGNYTVTGSPESVKLQGVEERYAEFSKSVDSLSNILLDEGLTSPHTGDINKKITAKYIDYYRECIKYVQANSHSLTVVPVFYQTVSDSFYVFSQDTDGFLFSIICDSLSTAYPSSKYVKSLREEAEKRKKSIELNRKFQNAAEIGFLDIELPDKTGKKIRLSDIDSKVILIHFWTVTDPAQKMFNLDVLKGIYADFHDKGLEIYQIAVDNDKPTWERTVMAQGLEWINVCDGLGTASPVLPLYNVNRLPITFVIADGAMLDEKVSDETSLRKVLKKLLQ